MRQSAKKHASIENGKKSRGPITAAGKNQASKNAFRHGLATPVLSRPGATEKVEEISICLVGENAKPKLVYLARKLAEALVDIQAIESHKLALLAPPWLRYRRLGWNSIVGSTVFSSKLVEKLDELNLKSKLTLRDLKTKVRVINSLNQNSSFSYIYQTEIKFKYVSDELKKLERYERRAFSRMMHAVRDFDEEKKNSFSDK